MNTPRQFSRSLVLASALPALLLLFGILSLQAQASAADAPAPLNWKTEQDHKNMSHFIAWANNHLKPVTF